MASRIVISLAVLLAASGLQWLLKLSAKGNTVGAGVFEWDDATLWSDWVNNALVAFGILLLKDGGEGEFSHYQAAIFLGATVAAFAIIPNYLRWYGTDSTGHFHKYRGVLVSNVMALIVLLAAVSAGVSLFE